MCSIDGAALLRASPLAAAIVDGEDGRIRVASFAFARLVGEDVEGASLAATLPELAAAAARVYATGTAERVDVARGAFAVQPAPDRDGRVVGVAIIATDGALPRQARHDVLERERNARTAAEAANRSKDEFVAMLSHELRNPLAPIATALGLMRMRGGFERERAIVERQVDHLVRLVDDLLDVSRIARGKIELKRERVEICDVVAQAIEMASPLLEERRHHLCVDVPRHGLRVDADPRRLGQVIANLLSNAAKYTPAGGHVHVSASLVDDEVVVRVSDDGDGIPPELLSRVFELFAQGERAIDRAQGGLGLGLAIVRNLVELHGGRVSASSGGRGRGAEFVVHLPSLIRAGVVPDEDRGAANDSVAPTGCCRVLVVDDNADAAELLVEALELVGYQTAVAHDGPTALERAARFRPDVALLDIGLPIMDGYELARRLRAMPGLGDVRLIAVTGYGQASDRERSAAAGFDEHLVKPVDLESLLRRLEELAGAQRGVEGAAGAASR